MKHLLIVVDYQKDFVDGSLGFEDAARIEPAIAAKIEKYEKNGDEIAFTFDTHEKNYLETQEGKNLPVPHCIADTDGWLLHGKIAALINERHIRFCKPAFGSAKLFDYLKDKQYASVELVGVVSNICVLSNAVLAKTALPETPVIVDAACVASNDRRLNEAALDVMQSLQIEIINR